MLAHVAPFARRGYRVDMAMSDRAKRKIVFQGTQSGAAGEPDTHLELYLLEAESSILIRIATLDDKLQATLTGKHERVEALLDAVAQIPAASQFRQAGDTVVADSFDVAPDTSPALTACAACVGGLIIEMDARTVVGEPMETTLRQMDPSAHYELPDDLLALADAAWRPLTTTDLGWGTSLRVPVREPKRSRLAMQRFGAMAAGVDAFLARSPLDYHCAHRGARLRLYARRCVPILSCVLIVASLPLLDRYVLGDEAAMHPGFLSLPPLLMIAAFALTWRDTPRIEIPPWPRTLMATAWPHQSTTP